MKQRGFTLIELLIVVAIIAILAAIAVPNFLEAQVRSKVSRAKSDIRSMATALEAYAVDNNHYPMDVTNPANPFANCFTATSPPAPCGYFWYISHIITTPVAYFTSNSLIDPFRSNATGALSQVEYGRYRYVNYKLTEYYTPPRPAGIPGTIHGPDYVEGQQRYGMWRLVSSGPDFTAGPFPASLGPSPAVGFPRGSLLYDPTNGTVSTGDIVRSQAASEGPAYVF